MSKSHKKGNRTKGAWRWTGPFVLPSKKGAAEVVEVAETTTETPPPRVTTLAEYLAARRKPAASTPKLVAAGS